MNEDKVITQIQSFVKGLEQNKIVDVDNDTATVINYVLDQAGVSSTTELWDTITKHPQISVL